MTYKVINYRANGITLAVSCPYEAEEDITKTLRGKGYEILYTLIRQL